MELEGEKPGSEHCMQEGNRILGQPDWCLDAEAAKAQGGVSRSPPFQRPLLRVPSQQRRPCACQSPDARQATGSDQEQNAQ